MLKAKVKVDMSGASNKIRAIAKNARAGSFAAMELYRLADKYVPYRDGALRASAVISPWKIIYTSPYALYMWRGIVKGTEIKYRTPGTTSHWTDNVNTADLADSITQYLKGL